MHSAHTIYVQLSLYLITVQPQRDVSMAVDSVLLISSLVCSLFMYCMALQFAKASH